ncbi:MAG: ferrous iron transporter B, partial [Gemmatimonadota bacterium]|nr:ferrous iron transporter B [Gemmatimonadota bacterium]
TEEVGDREIVDTPGLNDLAPRTDEARVTRELLAGHPDATVIQVADAKNLRRALLLTIQIAELRRSMVLVLNMWDELEERGGRIDLERLSEILGVPVVRSVAPRGEGTPELIAALDRAAVPKIAPDAGCAPPSDAARLDLTNGILAECWSISQPSHASMGVRLGFWAMHPVKGLAVLAGILLAVFWFVGLFGAGTLVDALEVAGFEQRVSPLAIRAADRVLPFPHEHAVETVPYAFSLPLSPAHEIVLHEADRTALRPAYEMPPGADLSAGQEVIRWIHDFLVGPYGQVTMALSYALAIVLPIVTVFFLVFSVLEDSGYFSRMSVMLNRAFRVIGLNGKAVLPMLLGLGCTTMATMTTRVLESRRERIVTTMLLALAVPCSAQLGVLLALMAALSPGGATVWLGLMAGVILLVGWLTARVFPGEGSDFILEVPPMRRPQLGNVVTKTYSRLEWYLKEVIPVFLVGTAALFLLDRIGALGAIGRAAEPLVVGWLGLPADMANALLVGFMRRDFGAVYILDAATGAGAILSAHQILVAMVTITLFMPCFATLLMISKEHGRRTAAGMVAFIFPFAILVGGLVNHVGRWLGTT